MNVFDLIGVLNTQNQKLPVCYFDSKKQEYFELEDDGSIEKVWDNNYEKWMLSLNENDDSLRYRLNK